MNVFEFLYLAILTTGLKSKLAWTGLVRPPLWIWQCFSIAACLIFKTTVFYEKVKAPSIFLQKELQQL
jgi:hypothetical protein